MNLPPPEWEMTERDALGGCVAALLVCLTFVALAVVVVGLVAFAGRLGW